MTAVALIIMTPPPPGPLNGLLLLRAGEGDRACFGVPNARPQDGHARPHEPRAGPQGSVPKARSPCVRGGVPTHRAGGDVPAARGPGAHFFLQTRQTFASLLAFSLLHVVSVVAAAVASIKRWQALACTRPLPDVLLYLVLSWWVSFGSGVNQSMRVGTSDLGAFQ